MHPEPVDVILDAAGQKETGKWTLMAALDAGEPLPLIGEAVFACWPIRSKRTFNRCEDTERWGAGMNEDWLFLPVLTFFTRRFLCRPLAKRMVEYSPCFVEIFA